MSELGGMVLDSTALQAFVAGRPYLAAVVWHAVDHGVVLVVPAAALADARARLVEADLQVLEVLLDLPATVLVDLDRREASQVAAVLAKAGTPELLPAGHAAWTARHRGIPVITDEGPVLRVLAADIAIDDIP